jgi:hypothetical protein
MNKYAYLLKVFLSIFISCSKIFEPKTDAGQNAIVVEGLISNLPGPYTVRLSIALPYSVNNGKYPPISGAKVIISDDSGNTFNLPESLTTPGAYVSDSTVFTGQTGISYTLHIETTEGDIFESSPQQILESDLLDTTFACYASTKVLNPDYGNNATYIQQGVDLLVDIKNNIVNASVFNRIISIKRYRLNQEAFLFYSNINSLLSAQGKIFDPVAFQLKGNITCKNNPAKTAFGYFEASSLVTSFYTIRPGKTDVNRIIGFNPPSYSGTVTIFNSVETPYIPIPDFLIF